MSEGVKTVSQSTDYNWLSEGPPSLNLHASKIHCVVPTAPSYVPFHAMMHSTNMSTSTHVLLGLNGAKHQLLLSVCVCVCVLVSALPNPGETIPCGYRPSPPPPPPPKDDKRWSGGQTSKTASANSIPSCWSPSYPEPGYDCRRRLPLDWKAPEKQLSHNVHLLLLRLRVPSPP